MDGSFLNLHSEIPIAFSLSPSITIPPSASHDSAILIVLSLSVFLARFQRWRHFGIRLPMVTSIVFHGLIFLVSTRASPSVDAVYGARASFRIARFKKLSPGPDLKEWKKVALGRFRKSGSRI